MVLPARRFLAMLGALRFVPSAWAQYIVPNPDVEDLTERWTVGDTFPIAWAGWSAEGTQPANCDLWITTFQDGAVEERILANVDLDGPGNFDWKVNLTSAQVLKDPQFVLRFVSHVNSDSPSFPVDSPMMGSRGFYLYPEVVSTSATPTPSPSSKSSPTTSSTTTIANSSQSSTPTDVAGGSGSTSSGSKGTKKKKKKSNTGAIAGGVLGGLVLIALLLVGVLFLLKRQKKGKKAVDEYGNQQTNEKSGIATYAHEMETRPAELPGSQHSEAELQGSSLGEHYAPSKQKP